MLAFKIFKGLIDLISSSAHPEPSYDCTSTDYCRAQAIFDELAVRILCVSLNTGTDYQDL